MTPYEKFNIYMELAGKLANEESVREELENLYRRQTDYSERMRELKEKRDDLDKEIDDMDEAMSWTRLEIDNILNDLSSKKEAQK